MTNLYPKTNPEGILTDTGITRVLHGTDPKDLNYTGTYWCGNWLDGSMPLASAYGIIEVINTDNKYKTIKAIYPSYETEFVNHYNDFKGEWSGWRLTNGKVDIWAGSIPVNEVTCQIPLSCFGSLDFYNNDGCIISGVINHHDSNVRASMIDTYYADFWYCGITASISGNKISILRPYKRKNATGEITTITITKIVGRP